MKTQVGNGDTLALTAPVAFVSGTGYKVGSMFGIAGFSCAIGESGVLWLRGVYTHAKTSAQAWTVGQLLYWDDTNKVVTSAAGTANLKIGFATAVAANPSSTGSIRLNGSF